MKTPLPKFPHHRGVPKHHFGDKTPLLATLPITGKDVSLFFAVVSIEVLVLLVFRTND